MGLLNPATKIPSGKNLTPLGISKALPLPILIIQGQGKKRRTALLTRQGDFLRTKATPSLLNHIASLIILETRGPCLCPCSPRIIFPLAPSNFTPATNATWCSKGFLPAGPGWTPSPTCSRHLPTQSPNPNGSLANPEGRGRGRSPLGRSKRWKPPSPQSQVSPLRRLPPLGQASLPTNCQTPTPRPDSNY